MNSLLSMNSLFHSETEDGKQFTSYQYPHMTEVFSPLIQVQFSEEVDTDPNTTGSATKTEVKGHSGHCMKVKQEVNKIWCLGSTFASIKCSGEQDRFITDGKPEARPWWDLGWKPVFRPPG